MQACTQYIRVSAGKNTKKIWKKRKTVIRDSQEKASRMALCTLAWINSWFVTSVLERHIQRGTETAYSPCMCLVCVYEGGRTDYKNAVVSAI